jgi:hypothetical protein
MNNRFTIRLKPLGGESLTGYIMRISLVNNVDYISVLNYLSKSKKEFTLRYNPTIIDTNPLEYIELEELSLLTGLEMNQFEEMTFMTLLKKFTDSIYFKPAQKCGLEISKNTRKFCPSCLKDYKSYKLIWQVSEIEICNIHLTNLKNKCGVCNTEQPYVSSNLGELKCVKCGSFLYKAAIEQINDKSYIEDQLNKYKLWSFLLNSSFQLFKPIDGFDKEKSLAITVLYACQRNKYNFEVSSIKKYFDRYFVYNILGLIKGQDNRMYVTVKKLSDLIKHLNIELEDFSNIVVPKEFIQSIMIYTSNKKLEPGGCEFDLCTSYGSNSKIKKITNPEMLRASYSTVFMCTNCNIIYGLNKDNQDWELIKADSIKVNRIKLILPLLSINNIMKIMQETNMSYREVYKAIGYIASHKLASPEIISKYIPNSEHEDIVSCFTILLREKGSMALNAKKIFNWSYKDFYYFASLPEVQEFLAFNSHKFKKRKYKPDNELEQIVKNEISNSFTNSDEIRSENIVEVMEISKDTIYRSGIAHVISKERKIRESEEIINKIDNFILKKEQNWEKLYTYEVGDVIGKSLQSIKISNPALYALISNKIDQYKEKQKQNLEIQYMENVSITINNLLELGKPITFNNIIKETNIPANVIYKNEKIKKVIDFKKSL